MGNFPTYHFSWWVIFLIGLFPDWIHLMGIFPDGLFSGIRVTVFTKYGYSFKKNLICDLTN